MVFPDTRTGESKEIKKQMNMVDKVYSPFLSKFFASTGTVPKAILDLQTALSLRLVRMIQILEDLFEKTVDDSAVAAKLAPKPDEKKKKEETDKRWYKIVKGKWFEKAAGFLKSLASVNFLTQLLGFIILLRMGLLQMVLPWLLSVVGGAITAIIKAIPALLKFFFNLLWVTIPEILKGIFRTIFKTLGIENKTLLKFGDMLAKILPMLIAIGFIWFKIGPYILKVISALGKIGPILAKLKIFGPMLKTMVGYLGKLNSGILKLGGILSKFVIKTLLPAMWSFLVSLWGFVSSLLTAAAPLLLAALPFIAIVASLVLLWIYAEKVSDFFDNLVERFKNLSTMGKILVSAISLIAFPITMFISLIYGIAKAFKFFKSNGFAEVFKKIWIGIKEGFSNIYKGIVSFFDSILNSILDKVKWIIDKSKNIYGIITNFFGFIISGFSNIGTGIKNFFSMFDPFFNSIWNGLLNIGKGIKNFFGSISSYIVNTISGITNFIMELNEKVYSALWNGIKAMLKFIISIPDRIFSAIRNVSKNLKKLTLWFVGLLKGMLTSMLEPFRNIFDGLKKITGPVIDAVAPLLSKLGNFIGSIGDTLSSVFDKVKSAFYGILDYLGNIIDYGWKWFSMGDKEKRVIEETDKALRTDKGDILTRLADSEARAKVTEKEAAQISTEDKMLAEEYITYKKKEGNDAHSFKRWYAENISKVQEGKSSGKVAEAFRSAPDRLKSFELNNAASESYKNNIDPQK